MGRGKNIEMIVEGDKDGGRDGEWNGDVDCTNSDDDDDSNRVKAVRLAAEGQQTCNNAKMKRNNLPVLPEPPVR